MCNLNQSSFSLFRIVGSAQRSACCPDGAPAIPTMRALSLSVLILIGGFVHQSEAVKHFVSCETTAGDLEIELDDALSPLGVARLLDLVNADFFKEQVSVLCTTSKESNPAFFPEIYLIQCLRPDSGTMLSKTRVLPY